MKSLPQALLGIFLALLLCSLGVAAEKPNILWLTSEDHGPQMGCYGDKLARTPNVDALAAKGMVFNRAWSVAPVCAPARTAIITGLYTSSSGGQHMRSMVSLPDEIKLYPHYLRAAGYYCTNNSKEDYNVRKQRDLWNESSANAHWTKRAAGQPFFAVFNSTKSHESQLRTRPHQQITDPAEVRVPAYHPDTPEVRQDWAQYYDKVSEADADAGKRLQELEEAGLAADTIVFYYGDHGSGMPRSKRWPCNSGLHVPLVVYFPEKWQHLAPKEYQTGGKSDRLVSFVDLAPTLLSIVGVEPPSSMQGHAFAGKYQAEPQPYLFGERGRMDERMDLVRSVTDGRYVYLRNYFPHVSQAQHVDYQFATPTTRVWRKLFDEGKATEAQAIFWREPKAPEELYDLQSDPDEVRNLAGSAEHRAVLEKLRKAQREHLVAIRDVCFLPEGELHSRSERSSPYQLARNDDKYPQARIVAAAELASNLSPAALPELNKLLKDTDSAVRWWAVLGHLMRGQAAVAGNELAIRQALRDDSPYVRIVAAQALGEYGADDARAAALKVLSEAAPPKENGLFVSISALAAIEALGDKASSLHPLVRELDPVVPGQDARYSNYVPRLIQNITPDAKPVDSPPKNKTKTKAKAK
ncbi:sulfatase-like hydrolase/transferase [Anatilimnocola sp. NA78]|uniref:sulfatase-like hydrolase/transferase n=1 Tax=Anatilimnocola sp. NA78 TaxID=3415683 RepID=UPI003CE4DFDC